MIAVFLLGRPQLGKPVLHVGLQAFESLIYVLLDAGNVFSQRLDTHFDRFRNRIAEGIGQKIGAAVQLVWSCQGLPSLLSIHVSENLSLTLTVAQPRPRVHDQPCKRSGCPLCRAVR